MIEDRYQELCKIPSDINEHLPTIKKYVIEGGTALELGVRDCVSTWALLAGKPKKMYSVDINLPPKKRLLEVKKACEEEGIVFRFWHGSSLFCFIDGKVDTLFIDTVHLYSHLIKELFRFSEKVGKYIIIHDTEILEMKACVVDFLHNDNWVLEEELTTGTGMIVLKRI